MNRTQILFFALIIMLSGCNLNTKKTYKLEASVQGSDSGKAYLQKRVNGKILSIDSAMIENGHFLMEGIIEAPEYINLVIEDAKGYKSFFLEQGEVFIDAHIDSLRNARVKGSVTHEQYTAYLESMSLLNSRKRDLYIDYREARGAGDEALLEAVSGELDSLDVVEKDLIVKYISKNPGKHISPFLINTNSWRFDLNELDGLLQGLSEELHASPYYIRMKERSDILKSVQIGKPAINFTMDDTLGRPVSLESFRGNYVLVDFWASWCAPCRQENPNVVANYNKYKNQGFTVLGVSFDSSKERWLQAIKDDNLEWTHVSDLSGWQNAVGKMYAINSIPSNILLDKQGIIIGRDLRGEDLSMKLQELF